MVELDADTRGIVVAAREAAPDLPPADVLARVELRMNWPHRLPIAGRIARAIGLGRDLAGDQRFLVARALLDELREDDVAFVRYVLAQELAYAEIVYNLCHVQTLQLCALMLYKLGHVEDSLAIWRAKIACFDAQSSIDVQCLCANGVDATTAHLQALDSDESHEAASYIEQCASLGQIGDLSAWEAVAEHNLREDCR